MNLPKTDDNDKTHKNDANTYRDMCSMLLSRKVPHSSFSHEKIPVLVQTLSYKSKITYHTLLIGFYHKLISMQDVWHVFHFNVAQQLSYSKFMHQCVFSLMKKMQSGTGNFLLTMI